MKHSYKKLLKKYVEHREGLAAHREGKRIKDELVLFLDFLSEKEINLVEIFELTDLDKSILVEYFTLIRAKRKDDDQAISAHIRAIQRFLHYLRSVGYIYICPENDTDRVKEAAGNYLCA